MLAQRIASNEDAAKKLAETELLLFEICTNAVENGGWLDPAIANAVIIFLDNTSANAIPQSNSTASGGEHGKNI